MRMVKTVLLVAILVMLGCDKNTVEYQVDVVDTITTETVDAEPVDIETVGTEPELVDTKPDFDFREVRWGYSMEQVKASEKFPVYAAVLPSRMKTSETLKSDLTLGDILLPEGFYFQSTNRFDSDIYLDNMSIYAALKSIPVKLFYNFDDNRLFEARYNILNMGKENVRAVIDYMVGLYQDPLLSTMDGVMIWETDRTRISLLFSESSSLYSWYVVIIFGSREYRGRYSQ